MRVLNDRILIKADVPKYEGSLVLPDAYEGGLIKAPDSGVVVSWGDKCRYKWSVGQRIWFARFAVQAFKFNGEEYRVINEHDIHMTDES